MFTFPMWILYSFLPKTYNKVKSILMIEFIDIDNFINIIMYIINTLILLNYIFIFFLIILFISFLIQNFSSSILNFSSLNTFRTDLKKSILNIFFRFAIYNVSICIYLDLLFNYNTPLRILYETNAYWVSIFPFILFVGALVILLVTPSYE